MLCYKIICWHREFPVLLDGSSCNVGTCSSVCHLCNNGIGFDVVGLLTCFDPCIHHGLFCDGDCSSCGNCYAQLMNHYPSGGQRRHSFRVLAHLVSFVAEVRFC